MSGQGKHKNLQLVQWLRNPWGRCDNVERGPILDWQAALMFEAANVIEHLETTRTPAPAQIRADALRDKLVQHIGIDMGKPGGDETVIVIRNPSPEVLALITTPLSPTAVDGSIAPDAGGKENK